MGYSEPVYYSYFLSSYCTGVDVGEEEERKLRKTVKKDNMHT